MPPDRPRPSRGNKTPPILKRPNDRPDSLTANQIEEAVARPNPKTPDVKTPPDSLTANQIEQAVSAYGLNPLPPDVAEKLATFASLLLRWNSKLNLTALRTPEQILERHFLESIFCAQHLPGNPVTLLDFGSGAGFPGIPIALCRPDIQVTLAESNQKKAAFLREAVRVLALPSTVYAGRVEAMEPDSLYDTITLRAVDKSKKALEAAALRVQPHGTLVLLTSLQLKDSIVVKGFIIESFLPVPMSETRIQLHLQRRTKGEMFHVEHLYK